MLKSLCKAVQHHAFTADLMLHEINKVLIEALLTVFLPVLLVNVSGVDGV